MGTNKAQGKFIAMEGLSGSGKTTLGKMLAEKLGGVFYKTPSGPYASIRAEVDEINEPLSRVMFYIAAVAHASFEIGKLVNAGQHVVCDRYWYTTMCWHRATGGTVEIPRVVAESLLIPDFGFLVVCEESTRLSRLHSRGMTINDERERKEDVEIRFMAEYRKHILWDIDNSSNDPGLALSQMLSYIQG